MRSSLSSRGRTTASTSPALPWAKFRNGRTTGTAEPESRDFGVRCLRGARQLADYVNQPAESAVWSEDSLTDARGVDNSERHSSLVARFPHHGHKAARLGAFRDSRPSQDARLGENDVIGTAPG
jgi:hypothetical protein